MKRLIVVAFACVISGSSFAQKVNDLPVAGQVSSLERWMISNKVDDETVRAMRVCEANVAPPTGPEDGTKARPYAADYAASCATIRKKMYDAAVTAASTQATSDKSLVDSVANK